MSRLQQLADRQFQQAFGTPTAANDPAAAQRKSAFQPLMQGLGGISQQMSGFEQTTMDGALNRMGLELGGGATASRAISLFGTDPAATRSFQTEDQYARYIQGIRPLEDQRNLLLAEMSRLQALQPKFLSQEGAMRERVQQSIGNFITAFDKEDASRGRINAVMDSLNEASFQLHGMAAGGVTRDLAVTPDLLMQQMTEQGLLPISNFIARKKAEGLSGYDLQVTVKNEIDRRRESFRNPQSALQALGGGIADLSERTFGQRFTQGIKDFLGDAREGLVNTLAAGFLDPVSVTFSAITGMETPGSAIAKGQIAETNRQIEQLEQSNLKNYDLTIDTRAVIDSLAYNAAAGFSDVASKRDGGRFQRDTYDALTAIFDIAGSGTNPDDSLNAFFTKMAEIEQRSGIDINEVHAGLQTMYDFAKASATTFGNRQLQQDQILEKHFNSRTLADLATNERARFNHIMELAEDQAQMYVKVRDTLADSMSFLESTGKKHREWSQANESGEGVMFQSTTISTPEMQKRSAQALLDGVLSAAAEGGNIDPNGLPAELNDALAQLPEEQVGVFMDYLRGTDRLRDQQRELVEVTGDINTLLETDLPRAMQDFQVADLAQRGRENVLFAQDRSEDEAILAELARAGT